MYDKILDFIFSNVEYDALWAPGDGFDFGYRTDKPNPNRQGNYAEDPTFQF